jgi:two-component system, sensor histidine kinase and response regulator
MTERSASASILVVDDTIENLRLLGSMLGEQEYEVRPVTSGRQALLAAEHDPPDLILLDINMPDMNGYEVCRRLKAIDALKEIPVVFLTALTDVSDKVQAFEAGGVDYITKPFELAEVVARVRTHLQLRRTQVELALSYQRLQALERARDDLVHMIVHDMRSPLMVLMGSLSLLELAAETGRRPADPIDLRAAMAAAGDLNRMAKDVLDVSRLEKAEMPIVRTDCDLVELAAGVEASLGAWERDRRIALRGGAPVRVRCDPGLVRRILENLIGNAIKHTPSGSEVEIAVTADAARARVEVLDRGPGIPPEARERIFEKYGAMQMRHDSTYHSVGLGLAFCKAAVDAHGGTIGVAPRDAGGSCFWFELPR